MIYSTDPICSWGDYRRPAPCSQLDPACDIKLSLENGRLAYCSVHGKDVQRVTFAREIPYNCHGGRFEFGPVWGRSPDPRDDF